MENKRGSKTDPWGTPQIKFFDYSPEAASCLSHRKQRPPAVPFLASPSSETPSEYQKTMGQSQKEGAWPEAQW